MSDLIIREAEPGDAARFSELWTILEQESAGFLFESTATGSVSVSGKDSSQGSSKPGYAHILFVDDPAQNRLAGFATGTSCQLPGHRNSLELVIAIKQAYSRQGWGYKLLSEMENWAVENTFQCLTLAVSANNTAALALYRKYGFETVMTDHETLKENEGYVAVHVMRKNLL